MERTIARIWPLAPAFAAVTGSVALSLLILQPPPAGLLPSAAPPSPGHVGALVLPAPLVHRLQQAPTTAPAVDVPRLVVPRHSAPLPAAAHHSASHPTSQPAHKPAPAPAPATTPAPSAPLTPPPPAQPVSSPSAPPPAQGPVSNGRWKSAKAHSWKASASRQSERTHRGRPPWAGPKHSDQKHGVEAAVPAPAAAPSPAHQGCHGRACAAAATTSPAAPAAHGHGKDRAPHAEAVQPTPAPAAPAPAAPSEPPSAPPGQDKGKKSPHT
jgi:hypothetical protein